LSSPFIPCAEGLRVLIRVSPKSAARRVLGLAERPDGRADLKIALTQPPEAGRANAELVKFLAQEWQVPTRSLSLLSGAADRRKSLLLEGDAARLQPALEAWLAGRLASRR
jgi:uncharacterized protein